MKRIVVYLCGCVSVIDDPETQKPSTNCEEHGVMIVVDSKVYSEQSGELIIEG